jgi:hypothetical protein
MFFHVVDHKAIEIDLVDALIVPYKNLVLIFASNRLERILAVELEVLKIIEAMLAAVVLFSPCRLTARDQHMNHGCRILRSDIKADQRVRMFSRLIAVADTTTLELVNKVNLLLAWK